MTSITTVTPENVSKTGFFCYMSKKKEPGYAKKMAWVKARLEEGLRIKMILPPDGRGFIEYIPAEYAWRGVDAPGYMFIHCLWIVGKTRRQGHARLLLGECIKEAKSLGMRGVAVLATSGTWLAPSSFFAANGFRSVAKEQPDFDLMALPFSDDTPAPWFSADWGARQQECGKGLTLFRDDQCPYVENVVKYFQKAAQEVGVSCKVVELRSAEEVRRLGPSPYGTFNAVLNGRLLDYHFMEFDKLKNAMHVLADFET